MNEQQILEALKPIQDPDLHRSIVDLGFIKNINISDGSVNFDLELTTPACPVKDQLKQACVDAVSALEGVNSVDVKLTAHTRGVSATNKEILKDVKNIIAVAAGKGGVGKSTTAVNLAVALQQTGASVGILDADIYGPSIPTMVHIEKEAQATGEQKLVPAEGLGMKIISMGLFVNSDQAAILRGPMVAKYISQFLGAVEWGELDYLIVDYPPGTGEVQLTMSQQAPITGALVVTTPQKIALIDVNRAIAMFNKTNVPVLGVVETMSYFQCTHSDEKHYIFGKGGGESMAQNNDIPFFGGIPIDPLVVEGGDNGAPIVLSHPDSPVAEAFRNISGAVAASLATMHMTQEDSVKSFDVAWKKF